VKILWHSLAAALAADGGSCLGRNRSVFLRPIWAKHGNKQASPSWYLMHTHGVLSVYGVPPCTFIMAGLLNLLAASQLSARVLTFGLNLAIARRLSPEAYGVRSLSSLVPTLCFSTCGACGIGMFCGYAQCQALRGEAARYTRGGHSTGCGNVDSGAQCFIC
jgi:hypothetical protein